MVRLSKEWVCVKSPSACSAGGQRSWLPVLWVPHWSWWGTGRRRRRRTHFPHPALKGTAMHPSWGISDFSQKAIDTNWPVLTGALSLMSLLFIARCIGMLLFPWPFLGSVKPSFSLNKHTHGKDLTQRLLKLLEGTFMATEVDLLWIW